MFFRLMCFLLGYVSFSVEGEHAARFFNILARTGPKIFFMHRSGPDVYLAACRPRDFPKLLSAVRTTGVKIEMKKKRGVPFTLHKYRKRAGLLCGLALFIAFTWFMSLFVWNIEITGEKSLTKDEIISVLKESGLYEGIYKSRLNSAEIKAKVMKKLPSLSFFSINVQGTLAKIEVREGVQPPAMLDDSVKCDVVARADGQIVEIRAYQGKTILRPGDTVKAGDIVVSGMFENKYDLRFVHARADIIARTARTIEEKVPLKQTITEETGKEKKYVSIKFFNFEIPLYFDKKAPYEQYATDTEIKEMQIGQVSLPVCRITRTCKEQKTGEKEYTEEEAMETARGKIRLREETELKNAKIDNKQAKESVNEGVVTITCEYELTENIAVQRAIAIN